MKGKKLNILFNMKMNNAITRFFVIAVSIILTSCFGLDDDSAADVRFSFFDFKEDAQGWTGDFANYTEASRVNLQLEVNRTDIPEKLGDSKSIKFSVNNLNEDLLMFMKRQVQGLDSNATYKIECEVRLISEMITDTSNIEDSKSMIYFKYGSSKIEPVTEFMENDSKHEFSLDAGDADKDGSDLKFIGRLGFPQSADQPKVHNITSYHKPIFVQTDNNGKLWLVFGIETKHDLHMSFYFDTIVIYYTKV